MYLLLLSILFPCIVNLLVTSWKNLSQILSIKCQLTFILETPNDVGRWHGGPVCCEFVVEFQHVLWWVNLDWILHGDVRQVQCLEKLILHALQQRVNVNTILLWEDIIEEGHIFFQRWLVKAHDGVASNRVSHQAEESTQLQGQRTHDSAQASRPTQEGLALLGCKWQFYLVERKCLVSLETSLETLPLSLPPPTILPLPPKVRLQ